MNFLLLLAFLRLPSPTPDSGHGLRIAQVATHTYVCTTWRDIGGGVVFPSNNTYVVGRTGILLLDTPWDSTQYQPFLDSLQARHGLPVTRCVSTHAHVDRTAMVGFLQARGIPCHASTHTIGLCHVNGEEVPDQPFTRDTTLMQDDIAVHLHFPGAGHTPDNIVAWLPSEGVLHGGCLVKSIESKGLGNIADANLTDWPASIQDLIARYPAAKVVVPGHQAWGGTKCLKHTLKLLRRHAKG